MPFTEIAEFHVCKLHSYAEIIGCVSSRKWDDVGDEKNSIAFFHKLPATRDCGFPKVFADGKLTLHRIPLHVHQFVNHEFAFNTSGMPSLRHY